MSDQYLTDPVSGIEKKRLIQFIEWLKAYVPQYFDKVPGVGEYFRLEFIANDTVVYCFVGAPDQETAITAEASANDLWYTMEEMDYLEGVYPIKIATGNPVVEWSAIDEFNDYFTSTLTSNNTKDFVFKLISLQINGLTAANPLTESTVQFTLEGTYDNQGVEEIPLAVWSMDQHEEFEDFYGTIDETGLLTVNGQEDDNTITVTAQKGDVSDTHQITLLQSIKVLESVTIMGPADLFESESGNFYASATYSGPGGGVVDVTNSPFIHWDIEQGGSASTDQTGVVTGTLVTEDTPATIKVTYEDPNLITRVHPKLQEATLSVNIKNVYANVNTVAGDDTLWEQTGPSTPYTSTLAYNYAEAGHSTTPLSVTWDLQDPVTNVSIDPVTGEVTVGQIESAETVVVRATSEDPANPGTMIVGTKQITIDLISAVSCQVAGTATLWEQLVAPEQYVSTLTMNTGASGVTPATNSWSIRGVAPNNVSIDQSTGHLTVGDLDQDYTIDIDVTSEDPENLGTFQNGTIQVTLQHFTAVSTEVTGAATVYEQTANEAYTATMTMNSGTSGVAPFAQSWSIQGVAPANVTIDQNTGELSVGAITGDSTITVQCSAQDPENLGSWIIGTIDVNIVAFVAQSVQVTGNLTVDDNTADVETYVATMTYNNGQGGYTPTNVTWSLQGTPPAGTSINATTGALTTGNVVGNQTITIEANVEDPENAGSFLIGTLEVTVSDAF